jgi:hypothetical protein
MPLKSMEVTAYASNISKDGSVIAGFGSPYTYDSVFPMVWLRGSFGAFLPPTYLCAKAAGAIYGGSPSGNVLTGDCQGIATVWTRDRASLTGFREIRIMAADGTPSMGIAYSAADQGAVTGKIAVTARCVIRLGM